MESDIKLNNGTVEITAEKAKVGVTSTEIVSGIASFHWISSTRYQTNRNNGSQG